MKKFYFILIALIAIISLSGCATVRNVSEGLGKGVVEDGRNTVNHLKTANAWWREHTW
ncbi:MAG: hypothetical protein PHQ96_00600 [Candidatus Omnitrophica bacterium]|nr:hypothetical protein [Candidatus Omnitrophota bacterium]